MYDSGIDKEWLGGMFGSVDTQSNLKHSGP